MSPTFDAQVAIIGAGPAGTAAAAHLGQLGVQDVVLVDRADFPRHKTCGSAVSPKGIETLKELGVWRKVEPEAYWINGIRIVTPDGHESYQSAGTEVQAIVCLREVLDHILLRAAIDRGITFVPYFSATSTIERDGCLEGFVGRDGRTVRARYTLVAGGSHCRIGTTPRPTRRVIQAIMGWWEGVPFRPNTVEMLFDRMVAPYYGWLFPENEHRVNIGITYEDTGEKHNARDLFARFIDKHYTKRLAGATQIGGLKGHPIHYSYEIGDLTGPGRLVIGEAGLMTHPSTAEGIYHGMRSGMMAAEAVSDILSGRASENTAFRTYERRCRRAFQLSFWGGAAFRQLVRSPLLDWMVRLGDQPLVKSSAARLMAAM